MRFILTIVLNGSYTTNQNSYIGYHTFPNEIESNKQYNATYLHQP